MAIYYLQYQSISHWFKDHLLYIYTKQHPLYVFIIIIIICSLEIEPMTFKLQVTNSSVWASRMHWLCLKSLSIPSFTKYSPLNEWMKQVSEFWQKVCRKCCVRFILTRHSQYMCILLAYIIIPLLTSAVQSLLRCIMVFNKYTFYNSDTTSNSGPLKKCTKGIRGDLRHS